MLRIIMTGLWHIPEIYTSRQRPFKRSPTNHQPIANQSPTTGSLSPINRQWIANQSPTSPQFSGHPLVVDFYGQFSPTTCQPVPNWSAIDRQLIADLFANEKWLYWSHGDCIVTAVFWSQGSHWQVAVHVWPGVNGDHPTDWMILLTHFIDMS